MEGIVLIKINRLIEDIIGDFLSVSLTEMNDVSLLKRTDTKFIVKQSLLPEILKQLQSDYVMLEIKGKRVMNYKSLYFDTPEKKFYLDHHNGKIKRTKIRMRSYVDSNLFFFEIKMKDGKGNTNKTRLPITDFQENLDNFYDDFIMEVTGESYDLKPTLWNSFSRMTLVNIERRERATIDIDLAYSFNQQSESVENLAIIELKQVRYDRKSPIAKALKKYSITPYGFSKYCIGMTHMHTDIKSNRFKPKLLRIKKLTA